MKIYLAATGPCNELWRERGMLPIYQRLLSYYFINIGSLDQRGVFQNIKKLNRGGRIGENQQSGATNSIRKGKAGPGKQGAD